MKPLTAEEIADLRRLGELDSLTYTGPRVAGMVQRLLDEVERSRALLKRIEWNAVGPLDPELNACPECEATLDVGKPKIHKPGCELAALLGP